jgi:hypothetical protein
VDIECPGTFQQWDSGSGRCSTNLELILVLVGILPVLCSLGWFCDVRRIISVERGDSRSRLELATKNFEEQNQRALKDQKRRLDAMKADVSYPPTWTENEDDKILVPVSPTSAEFWDVHDKLRAPPVEAFADVCPKSGERSKLTGTHSTFSCLFLLACRVVLPIERVIVACSKLGRHGERVDHAAAPDPEPRPLHLLRHPATAAAWAERHDAGWEGGRDGGLARHRLGRCCEHLFRHPGWVHECDARCLSSTII